MMICSAFSAALCLYFTPPEPEISELGIKVEADGLAELTGKVRGREDADCHPVAAAMTACAIKQGTEIYWISEESHPAHPASLFRGYVENGGSHRLEERGWYAGDPGEAIDFFNAARSGDLQPAP